MSKKRIWGIVLLVLGVFAAAGAAANGSFEKLSNGAGLSDIFTLLLMAALVVVGIVLIIKGKK